MNFITAFLGKVASKFLLENTNTSVYESTVGGTSSANEKSKEWIEMLKTLARIIDQFLPVVMIGLGVFGAIYAIVIGVRYAKAENDEAKSEIKKKLINIIIGVLIGLLIMIILDVFLKNSTSIVNWLNNANGAGSV